jgi:RHS repeat-associated protein
VARVLPDGTTWYTWYRLDAWDRAYDAAGNLNWRTNYALVQAFNVNNLNELTTATNTGTITIAGTTTSSATNVTVSGTGLTSGSASLYADCTWARTNASRPGGSASYTATGYDSLGRIDTSTVNVTLPSTVAYSYDLNGNLLSDGTRGFDYDDENQLIRVTLTNYWKSEFTYDGKLRRRIRKEFVWLNSAWAETNEVRYLYDGNLVVQERDLNNLPLVSYTRGRDLSGTLQSAGGIGGLLARTDHGPLTVASSRAHAYYRSDANGNVTTLTDPSQALVAMYVYDPFGNVVSQSGMLASPNSYRFSSKEYDATSGLVYYLYRFYDPPTQRWVNTDPTEEEGGVNLYNFTGNNPNNLVDADGLAWWPPSKWPKFRPGPAPPTSITPCTSPQDLAICWNICFVQNKQFGACNIVKMTKKLPLGWWWQSTFITCRCRDKPACPLFMW